MESLRELPWVRITAEGVAIVISILLAFSIEAWWSDRQDRLDEAVVLNALLAELKNFDAVFRRERQQAAAIQESARNLLDYARNPAAEIDDNQIDRWLSDTTWFSNANYADTPVIESLVSGGRLGLVSNRQLRANLIGWPTLVADFKSVVVTETDFVLQHYLPYLRANSSIAQIYAADDGQPGYPSQTYPYGREIEGFIPVSHKGLLQEVEFQNLLVDRVAFLNEYLDWYEESYEFVSVEEGIAALEQELGIESAPVDE